MDKCKRYEKCGNCHGKRRMERQLDPGPFSLDRLKYPGNFRDNGRVWPEITDCKACTNGMGCAGGEPVEQTGHYKHERGRTVKWQICLTCNKPVPPKPDVKESK